MLIWLGKDKEDSAYIEETSFEKQSEKLFLLDIPPSLRFFWKDSFAEQNQILFQSGIGVTLG
jgi:hypothetical protein